MPSIFKQLTQEVGKENCLVVNSGDNFLPRGKEEEKKAELIMKAYSLMRVDLIGLGEKEYVFGAPFLRHLANCFSGNFLCANLVDPGQTQSYFLPYIVIRRGNKQILITSILDPAYSNYLRRDKLTIINPVASLKRLKKEISHGPGGRHPQNPKNKIFKPVAMRTCRRCHTPNTDPEFNFEQDWLKVDYHRRGQPVPEINPRKK